MAAAPDLEVDSVVDLRPTIVAFDGQPRQGGRDVEIGQRPGGRRDALGNFRHPFDKRLENLAFHGQRPVGGASDPALQVAQFHGRVAHRVGHRLAVDERRALAGGDRAAMPGRHLDVIAEQVVVADLEGGNICFANVTFLQPGDETPALVAQRALLVEVRRIALGDESPVLDGDRQLLGQGPAKLLDQVVMIAQHRRSLGDGRGNAGKIIRFDIVTNDRGQVEAVADGSQVPRAAAAQGQARQRAFDIRTAAQMLGQGVALARRIDEELDAVQAPLDVRHGGQRRRQPRGQKPGPGAGHGQVDDTEQAAAAFAGQGLGQLQIAPGRRVDLHHRAAGQLAGRRDARQLALLRQFHVVDQGAAGGQLGPAEGAEGLQRAYPEQGFQPLAPVLAVEAGGGQRRQAIAPVGEHDGQPVALDQPLGNQDLAAVEPGQYRAQAARLDRLQQEFPGRDVDPGDPQPALGLRAGDQEIVAPGIQQGVLGQRARRDHANDLAPDHRFGAALLGLGRVLGLFADGDLEAAADQAHQIALVAVHRHAAHRNVLAQMLAALGQRDVERPGRLLGVLEEQLVEIAHAVEQQTVGMLALDGQILGHHRRHPLGSVGGRRGVAAGFLGDPVQGRFRAAVAAKGLETRRAA